MKARDPSGAAHPRAWILHRGEHLGGSVATEFVAERLELLSQLRFALLSVMQMPERGVRHQPIDGEFVLQREDLIDGAHDWRNRA